MRGWGKAAVKLVVVICAAILAFVFFAAQGNSGLAKNAAGNADTAREIRVVAAGLLRAVLADDEIAAWLGGLAHVSSCHCW